jgi:hypothetical protein
MYPAISVCLICMSVIQQTVKLQEEEEYSTVEKNKKIKKAWPHRKTPQNDGYVFKNCTYIINIHVCNTTNSLKGKEKKKKTNNSTYEKNKKRQEEKDKKRRIIRN